MNISFSDGVLLFWIFSIIGWLVQMLYNLIRNKKYVNSGFLRGPYCPVFGFAGLLLVAVLTPLEAYPWLVFLLALVLSAVIEFGTNWLLEKVTGVRWWDYTGQKFQFKGLLLLRNTIAFGILGTLFVYFIYPGFADLIGMIPEHIERFVATILTAIPLFDLLYLLSSVSKLEETMQEISGTLENLGENKEGFSWLIPQDLKKSREQLNEMRAARGAGPVSEEAMQQIFKLWQLRRDVARWVDAFPLMKYDNHAPALVEMRKYSSWYRGYGRHLKGYFKELFQRIKESQLQPPPKEKKGARKKAEIKNVAGERSFAAGIGFYKLCWVFIIGCVIGYLVETGYCIVTTGRIESRQGMLYGPFNQVYGFGAILMTVCLHPLAKYRDGWLFLGSAAIGGAFEWVVSWLQEAFFGTKSWDYTGEVLSFGGRTSLKFMIFWGFLGLLFMRIIYPRLSDLIEKIPNRMGKSLTWTIAIALAVNMVLSAAAVYRWSGRDQGVPASTGVERWLDQQYPDEYMQNVYPNMDMSSQIQEANQSADGVS
ncbi:MAG: putative ABC transporter permease [Oscillospiraceae bacterium]